MNSNSLDKLVEIARIGTIISAAIFIIAAVLAVFLFFKYDIRRIYLIRSGKAQKSSVQSITQNAFKTGPVGTSINLDYESGTLKSWMRETSSRLAGSPQTGTETEEQKYAKSDEGTSVLSDVGENAALKTKEQANLAIENKTSADKSKEAINRNTVFTEETHQSAKALEIGFRVTDELVLIHTQESA